MKIYDTTEAAQILGVTRQTMINWSKAGKFKEAFRTAGGHRRYTEEQLNQFLGIAPQTK